MNIMTASGRIGRRMTRLVNGLKDSEFLERGAVEILFGGAKYSRLSGR
jgi:hypothetical protein